MAKFSKETVDAWTARIEGWLVEKSSLTREEIKQGSTAWSIFNQCGLLSEVYKDRTVLDDHIRTALKRIFPNAAFKD